MESNFKNLLYESFDNKKRLIIIDWDDTLLPTYWIHLNEENNKCVSIIDHDLKIKYFLDKCQNYGKVIIITNSSSNWIGSTSKNYLSNTHDKFNELELISARDEYQEDYPYDPMQWKKNVFKDYLSKNNNYNEILSIGDGNYEKFALFDLKNSNKKYILKSIKLIEKPSFLQLSTQIDIILNIIDDVCEKNENLDLNININDINQYLYY